MMDTVYHLDRRIQTKGVSEDSDEGNIWVYEECSDRRMGKKHARKRFTIYKLFLITMMTATLQLLLLLLY